MSGDMDLYGVLGVDEESSEQEIKKQYYKKAKEHHPDTENGDPEKFRQVSYAYSVLSDPDMKSKYDAGEDLDQNDPMTEARNIVIETLFTVIDNCGGVEYRDVVSMCSKIASQNLNKVEQAIEKEEDSIDKCIAVRDRLETDESFIFTCLENRIRGKKKEKKELENKAEIFKEAVSIFGNMTYNKDEHEMDDFFNAKSSQFTFASE